MGWKAVWGWLEKHVVDRGRRRCFDRIRVRPGEDTKPAPKAPATQKVPIIPSSPKRAVACPQSHPWAYRPLHHFDVCCRTSADCNDIAGRNSNENINARSECCANHDYVACTSPPCNDYHSNK